MRLWLRIILTNNRERVTGWSKANSSDQGETNNLLWMEAEGENQKNRPLGIQHGGPI